MRHAPHFVSTINESRRTLVAPMAREENNRRDGHAVEDQPLNGRTNSHGGMRNVMRVPSKRVGEPARTEWTMPGYVEIDGHPTWVDDRGGPGTPLLLLHGGLSNSDELLNSIGAGLAERYRVVAFDRRGHGYTSDTDADFHYADMADETVRVLEQVVGGPAHLVGWSDGGIVALLVALQRPDLVQRLVVIGANYHFDGSMAVEMDPESSLAQALG